MMKRRIKFKKEELLKLQYNQKTKTIFALLKLLSFQNRKFTQIIKFSMSFQHPHSLKINQLLYKTSFQDLYLSPNLQQFVVKKHSIPQFVEIREQSKFNLSLFLEILYSKQDSLYMEILTIMNCLEQPSLILAFLIATA